MEQPRRTRLAALRDRVTALADDDDHGGHPDDDDDIRERYSELLEDCADDPALMTALRALGRDIAALEERGVLPRVMIRRGAWRRPGSETPNQSDP